MAKTSVGILLLLLFMPQVMPGEILDNIFRSKLLRVATDSNWPPQSFVNDRNEMDGFDVDVARQIAERLGVAVQFVTPGWDIIVSGDWNNRWDIHVGSMKPGSITSKKLVFPAVYYYTPAVVAVHRDAGITQIDQLNGKTIGAAIDTSYDFYLQGRPIETALAFSYRINNAAIKRYENSVNALDDLQNNPKLDAVVAEMPTVLAAINKGSPIKILGRPLFYEPLVISIEAGDIEFQRKLEEIIYDMHNDGILSKLSMKWYRVDYTTAE